MEETNKEKLLESFPVPVTMECTDTILKQMKECICKINNQKGKGTGFFCYIPNNNKKIPVLITCNHVIDEEIIKKDDNIIVTLNNDKEKKIINLNKNRKIYTNKKERYDTTIIEIKEGDNINKFLDLDVHLFDDIQNICNENIYVIQYPKLKLSQQIAAVSYGILKTIDNEYKINHTCSTETGASGSPILNTSENRVIGIHTESSPKNNYNIGTHLKYPINEFLNNINLIKKGNDINIKLQSDNKNNKNFAQTERKNNGKKVDTQKEQNLNKTLTQKNENTNINNNINTQVKKNNNDNTYTKNIYKAMLAEQCSRYEEMCDFLEDEFKHRDKDFNEDERNLLSNAYKSYIQEIRATMKTILAYERTEKKKKKSSVLTYTIIYKEQTLNDLIKRCQRVIKIVDDYLLKRAENDEAIVFYLKMKADYFRYIAESAEGNLKKQKSDSSLKYYEEAIKRAKKLDVLNSIRLGLFINYSLFYYEILNNHKKAIDIAKNAVSEADKELPNIDKDADENKDTVNMYNSLKENLDIWESKEEKK